MTPIESLGDFVSGRFIPPAQPTGEIDVRSPADLDDVVGRFPTQTSHVDDAVEAARRAADAWERTSLDDRIALVRRFGEELRLREDELTQRLSREVGKPAWEARTEVRALQSKIDVTVNDGLALVRGFAIDGGKHECIYRPHGVLAVIGPYNFPLHLPHGHIVPALLTGNTVVFKPSEVAPATAQLYAEAAQAAGFPAGVFNQVQGRGAEGARLTAHPDVDGVLFTGSYDTGVAITKANAARPGCMLALELGGKNTAVVLADAPWDKTLHDVLFSAFVTAGQRCTAVSRVVVERPVADRFIEEFCRRASRLAVGHWSQPDVFMGPVATRAGWEKFHWAQEAALQDGARVALASGEVQAGRRGYYVSPSVHVVDRPQRGSAYQHTEIFAPDVAVYVADDLEHACAVADDTDYGLAASVFTESEASFQASAARLRVGCLGWNSPTVGSSSKMPFGGVRRSGNHRPAALFSTLYCTYPVAVTRGVSQLPASLSPGMHWNGE